MSSSMRCAWARKAGQSDGSRVSRSGDGDACSSRMFRRRKALSTYDVSDGVDMADATSIVGMAGKIQWRRAEGRPSAGWQAKAKLKHAPPNPSLTWRSRNQTESRFPAETLRR